MTKEEIILYNADDLCKPEIINEILTDSVDEVDFSERENWLMDHAHNMKVTRKVQRLVSAFKKIYREELKRRRKEEEAQEYKQNVTNFTQADGSSLELRCGAWIADNTGIIKLTDRGEVRACYHPIYPEKRLKNTETGMERVVVTFKRDGIWRSVTVDKDLIASASKITKLAGLGVGVNSENARYLVQYMSDVENFNTIPVGESTSKFGWIKDTLDFSPYFENIQFDAAAHFDELRHSIRANGLQEQWFDLVLEIRRAGRIEPRVAMSTAFASVLLKWLNVQPFIVNLWAKTGAGKTVCEMLACSIWADPGESRYITDSYSTQNAFEIRLDVLNDLPLLLDDMSKVQDRYNDSFTDLIYMLASGRGKGRSNVDLGLNQMKTWRCAILSNMERPLTNDTMKGGAINRVLDFECGETDIFPDGRIVAETVKAHFGFAGPMFLEVVRNVGTAEIKAIYLEYQRKICEEADKQGSKKEQKQIQPLAALLTADKLATDHIFKDDKYLDLTVCVSNLKDVEEVSEGRRGYEYIMSFTHENYTAFHADDSYNGKIYGMEEPDGYVYIFPNIFNKIAQEGNFSKKAFLAWADARKLIKKTATSYQIAKRFGPKACRFYAVKIEDLEETPDVEDEPEEKTKNAPNDGFTSLDGDLEKLPFD